MHTLYSGTPDCGTPDCIVMPTLKLYNMHVALYTVHYTEYTVQYTLYILHSAMHTLYLCKKTKNNTTMVKEGEKSGESVPPLVSITRGQGTINIIIVRYLACDFPVP